MLEIKYVQWDACELHFSDSWAIVFPSVLKENDEDDPEVVRCLFQWAKDGVAPVDDQLETWRILRTLRKWLSPNNNGH